MKDKEFLGSKVFRDLIIFKQSCYIIVANKAKLSLQMHQQRAERWVVVSGIAAVTNG